MNNSSFNKLFALFKYEHPLQSAYVAHNTLTNILLM